MEGTPCRTVLALDTTSLIETKIIRAVRDRESTVVGVLVGPGEDHDIDYDVIDTANQLSMHLGIAPPGHWRLTGEHGRPEFYPATRPRLHDWRDFLTGLGVRLDDDGAWKAISDPGLRPGREPGTGSQRLRCLAPGGYLKGPGRSAEAVSRASARQGVALHANLTILAQLADALTKAETGRLAA